MEQTINQGQPVNQPVDNNPPPVSPPPKNSFPVLRVVLLIILVGLGSFLLGKSLTQPKIVQPPAVSEISPTPEIPIATSTPTTLTVSADWKTYKDETLKFEIKYPNNWQIVKSEVNGIMICLEKTYQGPPKSCFIINTLNLKTDFETYLRKIENDSQKYSAVGNKFKSENYVLDKKTGIKVNIPSGIGIPFASIYLPTSTSSTYLTITFDEAENDHLKILSTFKFLP